MTSGWLLHVIAVLGAFLILIPFIAINRGDSEMVGMRIFSATS
jgi:hypothetical protein